jgi:glycosyltransferase involved in cell wall biosynthesis
MGIDGRRVELVPNAIDAATINARDFDSADALSEQLGVTPLTPIVLGVFRLSEEKRPLLFVETFAAVIAKVPGARAFVAGVGLLEGDMRRRIDEVGLSDSLTLLGRRDDVLELMRISSVLLLTSSLEGMPNVVMEAQAVGLPVVASNVGGVSDCMVDDETGYLVDPEDSEGYAAKCIKLLESERLRTRFGQAGASFMRNAFSRRAMAERYLQVLHDAEVTAPEQAEALRIAAA